MVAGMTAAILGEGMPASAAPGRCTVWGR